MKKWTLKIVDSYPKATFEFEDFEEMTNVLASLTEAAVGELTYEISFKKVEEGGVE